MTLGQHITALRKGKALSQSELGKKAGDIGGYYRALRKGTK